jgi:hypothetical protein
LIRADGGEVGAPGETTRVGVGVTTLGSGAPGVLAGGVVAGVLGFRDRWGEGRTAFGACGAGADDSPGRGADFLRGFFAAGFLVVDFLVVLFLAADFLVDVLAAAFFVVFFLAAFLVAFFFVAFFLLVFFLAAFLVAFFLVPFFFVTFFLAAFFFPAFFLTLRAAAPFDFFFDTFGMEDLLRATLVSQRCRARVQST